MPSRHTLRQYADTMFLHVYNRGVEKRKIFLDKQDYKTFLYYCFIYLANPKIVAVSYPGLKINLRKNTMFGKIELHSYCLMPNHFHMLIKQNEISATTKFLRQLTNAYTRYFNEKYKRVGSLVQGKFKAAHVETDEYILQLSRYIHRNPAKLDKFRNGLPLNEYLWSSYPIYIRPINSPLITKEFVLGYFSGLKEESYRKFVEEIDEENNLPSDLLIEEIEEKG